MKYKGEIIIYLLILLGLMVIYVATIGYKKKNRKNIDKNKYKFWMFWGLSMFLLDRFPKKKTHKEGKTEKSIRLLTAKENISEEIYLYKVEKISTSIGIIFLSLLIATGVSINEKNSDKAISSLSRQEGVYQIQVEKGNGTQEEIYLEVPKRELTNEEMLNKVEEASNLLEKMMLGKNDSVENVCYTLDLVSEIKEKDVSVVWDISDSSVVDYEGKLAADIPEEGVKVELEATLMLEDIKKTKTFLLTVYPSKEDVDVQEYLQEYVEENDIYSEELKLPTQIGQDTVTYKLATDKYGHILGLASILLGILVFFLKDKDLDKEIKARNKQLIYDYPEIVSKLLLYYGAGLSIKATFEEIVRDYKKNGKEHRYVYKEMELALNKMKTGVSEVVAIGEFGNCCGVQCYIKMASIIEQNIKRGTKEITYALKNELSNAMFERKNQALKTGSEISTKLLGPMLVMLVVAIVVVMAPALLSMKM